MKPTIRITIDKGAFTDEQWSRAQAKYPALDLQIELEVKTYIQVNDGLVAERYLVVLEPDSASRRASSPRCLA